jgi:hypothetical protein
MLMVTELDDNSPFWIKEVSFLGHVISPRQGERGIGLEAANVGT